MAQASYDLVVIGSGPAGQKAALNAAKLGKRVALIDRKDLVGGVCIHTGTIPSKAIREAVLHLTAFNERSVYGNSYAVKHSITMDDLLYRCHHVVRTEVDVINNQMNRNGVEMLFGDASFVDPHTVRVATTREEMEIRGQHILIAVGTEPARPKSVPFAPAKVIDSNGLLQLKDLPRSLIIVGGGVIGTEYASMLAAAGTKVTLVESRPRLLDFIDEEIGESLQFRLRDMGVRLRLGESVAKIELVDDCVEAELGSKKRIRADALLYTIGRQGATASLNLPAAGLTADERGRMKVNEFLQTAVPHIYAAGDVIGFPALAATSMEQGRLASSHMFHQLTEPANQLFPYGIYTIPEISMVGATEQGLTQQGVPYEVGVARYREIARGQLIADTHGMLKLIFHQESRRLLGVHAIGTGATELIHIGQAVIVAGMTLDYFVEAIFNYPTLAECYKVAAMDGMNRVRPANATVVEMPQTCEPKPPLAA
ncbi:MAG TPA: Si-specific NAD(P)(+) transhydrogenase [Tepidisphaeraceae bacterium]|jgi:NAD(P) transhydrogenase|nr:Si-specific NAD(P)(+) transhydrogenase [Tepidisphaeraceae bacterium]